MINRSGSVFNQYNLKCQIIKAIKKCSFTKRFKIYLFTKSHVSKWIYRPIMFYIYLKLEMNVNTIDSVKILTKRL